MACRARTARSWVARRCVHRSGGGVETGPGVAVRCTGPERLVPRATAAAAAEAFIAFRHWAARIGKTPGLLPPPEGEGEGEKAPPTPHPSTESTFDASSRLPHHPPRLEGQRNHHDHEGKD